MLGESVEGQTYFRLSMQNLLDLLTLGVVIGDVGFSVGAMLQEDLCGTWHTISQESKETDQVEMVMH